MQEDRNKIVVIYCYIYCSELAISELQPLHKAFSEVYNQPNDLSRVSRVEDLTYFLSFRSTSDQRSWASLLIHSRSDQWTSMCKIKNQTKIPSENQNPHARIRKHIRHHYKQQSRNSKPGLRTCRQGICMDGG